MFVLGVVEEFFVDVGAFPLEEGFLLLLGLLEFLFEESDLLLVAMVEFLEGFFELEIVLAQFGQFGVLFLCVLVRGLLVVHFKGNDKIST